MRTIKIDDDDTVATLTQKLASDESEVCKLLVRHPHVPLVLSCFRQNRSQRKSHVDYYVKVFRTERFWKTGSTLHADIRGRLVNGQHRITAQMIAEVDQEYYIEVGCSESRIRELDKGIEVRRLKDELFTSDTRLLKTIVRGEARKATAVAGVVKALYHVLTHERGLDDFEADQIIKYYRKDLEWIAQEVVPSNLLNRLPFLLATLLACRYVRDNGQWDDFTDAVARLKSGEKLDGVLLAVREYILSFRKTVGAERNQSRKPKDSYWASLNKMLRAWRLFLEGAPSSANKPRLHMVADFGALLRWFLGEDRDALSEKLELHPVRRLLPASTDECES